MLLSALLILGQVSSEPAGEVPEKPGLAALDVTTMRGVDRSLGTIVSDAILTGLKAGGDFGSVMGASDIAAVINLEQQKQALGCDDDSCLAQLAGALGVPYLFTGSLGIVGGRYLLSLKIINVEDGKGVARVSAGFEDERLLTEGLSSLTKALVTEYRKSRLTSTALLAQKAKPWISGTAGILGAALAITGLLQFRSAQSVYDESPSVESSDALEAAAATANGLVTGGLVAVGVGALAWIVMP